MKKLILCILLALAKMTSNAETVAEEGAWCWFADPRALHYESPDGRIDATYLGYIDVHGNIKAMQYDFRNRKKTEVLLRSYFQPDDHDNPTFLALPDGRIAVFYSRHTDEPCFYYRISDVRGDITTLGQEKVLPTADNTTYPSPFILRDDPDHIYLCWRGINWHPTIARLTLPDSNGDMHFDWGPYQIVQSSGARPYAKYASDGKSKIYMAYTTGHPDNERPNYLYLNYIDICDGTLRDIEGNVLQNIENQPFAIDKSNDYVARYPATVVDASPSRDWLWQVALDADGSPVIAMTRISNDKKHHNYYLASRKDDKWQLHHIAYAGGHFHQSPDIELCYSGGMAIEPGNTSVVYCSEPVEGANGRIYEIVKYRLDKNGDICEREMITRDSEKNNSRPYCVPGSDESALKLAWMQGDYYDWIVSNQRPQAFGTSIVCDYDCEWSPRNAPETSRFDLSEDSCYEIALVAQTQGKRPQKVLDFGDLTYWIDPATLKPFVKYKKKTYHSSNALATSDSWAAADRSTNGVWHAPVPLDTFELKLDYSDGLLQTFIDGRLDQSIRIKEPKKEAAVFEVIDPDYTLSPYSGMTRKHWIDAGIYLLDGAFGYISDIDDAMYFPKQLDKTYPRDDSTVPVAKLEGLARTFFLAAPLLRENPDLTLNGIKVADYYRHHIRQLAKAGSSDYTPPCPGHPTQTLLELASICLSMQIVEDLVWNQFTQEEKDALVQLFKSYGEGPTHNSNWRFFNVFILSFLKEQGYEINEDYLIENLASLLEHYRGEGWYSDTPAYDYYSQWAFQTYGPLWAQLWGNKQLPDMARQFIDNQRDMVENYPYMFARDGRMNMWGRSLPYRFAAVAPFAMVENGCGGDVNYGWLRNISSACLLQFMQDPGFMEDGIPTMGFYGVFAPAVQIYSCRGSVYWIGKAFFNLLLPADSKYWTAVENRGAWDTELQPGNVYNRFQPASNLLITDYPNCGGAEMRSWCKERVANDWQKFRSSENYNKLAYHTEFPWMADGPNGEVSMNYATLNSHGDWEVLRLYDFQSYDDGVYRRDAVLEVDPEAKYQLADIPLPDGVLRVDRVTLPYATDLRLGSYSLPDVGKGLHSRTQSLKSGIEASVISNGEYQLAVIPYAGWADTHAVEAWGLHPVGERCMVLTNEAKAPAESKIYVTLQLWKKGEKPFTNAELEVIKSVEIDAAQSQATITFANGSVKQIKFD